MSKLGPKYKAPWQTTPRENEILSWYHRGQGDPLYAVMSRCVGRKATKASEEELDAIVDAMSDAVNDKDNSGMDRQVAAGMVRRARSLMKKYFSESTNTPLEALLSEMRGGALHEEGPASKRNADRAIGDLLNWSDKNVTQDCWRTGSTSTKNSEGVISLKGMSKQKKAAVIRKVRKYLEDNGFTMTRKSPGRMEFEDDFKSVDDSRRDAVLKWKGNNLNIWMHADYWVR